MLFSDMYPYAKAAFDCMKVVDYHGPPELKAACYSSNDVTIKIHVYQLYSIQEKREELQQAVVKPMPHLEFDGQWSK